MFSVGKTIEFAAAHHLPQLPPEHKCHRVHGHNYKVEVELAAEDLDDRQFVEDYALLSDAIRAYDHRDLNDFFPVPTAEVLAQYFCEKITAAVRTGVRVVYVTVQETDDSWASYIPE